MGRDWLYWVTGSGSAGRRRKTSSGEMKEAATASASASASAGCMCVVFQLFDLHHFQQPANIDTSFLHEEATSSKGVEAPRNSLELEEEPPVSRSSAMKEEDNLNFPVGIQIKTSRSRQAKKISTSSPRVSTCASTPRTAKTTTTLDDLSLNSPATKTPSLVARLMGLDLLPECNSPSINAFSSKPTPSQTRDRNYRQTRSSRRSTSFIEDNISINGAMSLPETPRVSSSSARRSDFEYHHHRLSLQNEDTSRKGSRFRQQQQQQQQDHENRMISSSSSTSSPGHYAKQIVKQVKESVSRRVALLDITNRNKDSEVVRRDQNLIILKPTKKSCSKLDSDISPASVTPKLRFLDTNKNKQVSNILGMKSSRISSSSSSSSDYHNHQSLGILNPHQEHQQQQHKDEESKKSGSGKSNSSPGVRKLVQPQGRSNAIRNMKEEPFVRSANKIAEKKCKKTPLLSSDILNISGPTILQVKKDPSPPPTKLPHKQVVSSDAASLSSKRSTQQLSSNPRHSYKQHHLLSDNPNGCATATAGGAAAEYKNYIQKILRRAASTNKWHTPSHPIDPSIFYHLELFQPTTTATAATILTHRCNRRLIFHLVDELLAEILKPHFVSKNWVPEKPNLSLVDEVCKKIDDFPAKNCQVLEDIDSLIDRDMGQKSNVRGLWLSDQGELESIVSEIEGEIMEGLVVETAAAMVVRD